MLRDIGGTMMEDSSPGYSVENDENSGKVLS